MKDKIILNALVLSGALALTAGPTWPAGDKESGGTGSDKFKPRPEISTPSESSRESRESGQTTSSKESGMSSRMRGQESAKTHSADTVKQVQQALKDKGHDPGSIDGIMGQRTQDALRSFQQKEGLQATGTLDAQTAEKLGVSMAARGGKSTGDLKPGRNEVERGLNTGEARKDRQKNVE
jgi:hypothetical protein